jgi:hypothetical protein
VSDAHESGLWQSVDDLVDRAPTAADLVAHRLFMLAARRYRALGRPLPQVLAALEVQTAARMLALTPFLERLRDASTEALLILKGPEIAFRYPDPALRPFTDVDILVPDPQAVHDELISAGFFEVGPEEKYVGIHHLRPLAVGALPLVVELHHTPKWINGIAPPAVAELFSLAIPAGLPVDGFLALPPGPHALLVAAHAWAHTPLRRMLDLLDVEVLLGGEDARRAAERLAGPWGMARVWSATTDAADAVLRGGRTPLTMRTWARNIRLVRERTVLENHFERWFSCWWELPAGHAAARTADRIARDLRPRPGERRRTKLHRTLRAMRRATTRRGEHEHALRREASHRQD